MTTKPGKYIELLLGEIKSQKVKKYLISEDLLTLDQSVKDGADDNSLAS
ncbi:8108_t:CDS:2 [Entrophospora sp. SA101]|nr:8108_t:CDS:2 [Entrophospora sp. SA101]